MGTTMEDMAMVAMKATGIDSSPGQKRSGGFVPMAPMECAVALVTG